MQNNRREIKPPTDDKDKKEVKEETKEVKEGEEAKTSDEMEEGDGEFPEEKDLIADFADENEEDVKEE